MQRKSTQQNNTTTTPNFIFDSERLLGVASNDVYKEGLSYFKDDRVMEHYLQQHRLFSTVEGSHSEVPYYVEMQFDERGQLHCVCGCNNTSATICKHAVATLLSYAEGSKNNALYGSAKETAIRDRVKRGQTEVKASHIDGKPWFGTWRAESILSTTHRQQGYSVLIRSFSDKVNYCTCLDFANNQLGTCKHIEAVLHQLGKKPIHTNKLQVLPFVYQSFREDGHIRVQRCGGISTDLGQIIDQYFDAQGIFSGQLPGDFFKFSDAVYSNNSILIGDDAKRSVQRMLEQQSHQLKSNQTLQQVMHTDGVLPGIKAKLYPYQLEGVAFLAASGRGLLADDMGLGKTLQAIAAASWLVSHSGVKRVLIVCPASLKHQWAREIEKFSGHSTQIIQGGPSKRHAQYTQDKTFFILNYELALRDLPVINETLAPDLMILDEAQRIKNWRTKIATNIKAIQSRYAFVLTGTPLENRLEDLYSLMQVVDQNVLGPLWRYLSDYHITDESGKVQGFRNLSELRQRISGAMLRRNRTIVADQLPDRSTVRLDIPMTENQRGLHNSAMSAASQLANIAKSRPLTPSERNRMMSALQQARMACDAAGLVDKVTKGSPKLNELKTLIEEQCVDNGLKMVVFSQWRTMTTMVEEMLRNMNVGFVHLHGGVPTSKRGELMDIFKDDDSCQVFVSTDAGGSGLNLQSASVLVNIDIPWNPAVLEQRNSRIHRLGQTNKVQIILMIAQDSYEQRVYQLVNNKQDLFDNVVDPEGTEDIVGVSKKALESVVDDLAKDKTPDKEEENKAGDTEDEIPPIKQPVPQEKPTSPADLVVLPPQLLSEEDGQIKVGLIAIQTYFGHRIEQVMAKGGGLLIILTDLQTSDNDFIEALGLTIPAAIVDVKTLRQLQQLGIDPLTTDAQSIDLPQSVSSNINQWHQRANQQMAEASLLASQGEYNDVMDLMCSAIANVLTDKAQMEQVMAIENVPVWLYAEAVPEDIISVEQAYTISRVVGLRVAKSIPESLIQQSFEDTKDLIEELME